MLQVISVSVSGWSTKVSSIVNRPATSIKGSHLQVKVQPSLCIPLSFILSHLSLSPVSVSLSLNKCSTSHSHLDQSSGLGSLSFPSLVSAVSLTRSDPLTISCSLSLDLVKCQPLIYFLAPCFLCFFFSPHPSCTLISSSLYLSPLYIYLSLSLSPYSISIIHLSYSALSVTLLPPPTPAVSLTNVLGTYSLCLFYHCTRTESTSKHNLMVDVDQIHSVWHVDYGFSPLDKTFKEHFSLLNSNKDSF